MYFNAAKYGTRTGKLEEKWKGPYYVHEVIVNGSYKIKELNGKILKKHVNGELLKEYFYMNNLSWDWDPSSILKFVGHKFFKRGKKCND